LYGTLWTDDIFGTVVESRTVSVVSLPQSVAEEAVERRRVQASTIAGSVDLGLCETSRTANLHSRLPSFVDVVPFRLAYVIEPLTDEVANKVSGKDMPYHAASLMSGTP